MRESIRSRDPIQRPIIVVLLASLSAFGLANDVDERLSQARRESAAERRSRIKSELGTLKRPAWAGEYCQGDFRGDHCHPPCLRLLLDAQSGFVFESYYYTRDAVHNRYSSGLSDLDYGTVEVGTEALSLTPELPKRLTPYYAAYSDLVPVTWTGRHFLIPVSNMTAFLNHINAGWEPRFEAKFLLRRGDEKKPVRGKPDLPPNYRTRLLSKPIIATIVDLGDFTMYPGWPYNARRITLDVGDGDGVWEGMRFYRKGVAYCWAEVTRTTADSSEAVLIFNDVRHATAGWKLSTQGPRYTRRALPKGTSKVHSH